MALSLGVLSSARSGNLAAGFTSIATVTAAGGETSLTFSSIPQTYTDLQIRGLSREVTNSAGATTYLRLNGDTGANYSDHMLRALNLTSNASGNASATKAIVGFDTADSSYSANIFSVTVIDISDYTSTTKNKTFRAVTGTDNNLATTAVIAVHSGAWYSTSAVTSVTLLSLGAGGFVAGTTFALYGIKGFA